MQNISDWWAVCHDNKDELKALVVLWHPASPQFAKMDIDKVTAPGAEKAVDPVRDMIRKQHDGEDVVRIFEKGVADKDFTAVVDILQQVWFGSPEHRGVHNVPGFRSLCDLLDWVM